MNAPHKRLVHIGKCWGGRGDALDARCRDSREFWTRELSECFAIGAEIIEKAYLYLFVAQNIGLSTGLSKDSYGNQKGFEPDINIKRVYYLRSKTKCSVSQHNFLSLKLVFRSITTAGNLLLVQPYLFAFNQSKSDTEPRF